MLVDTNLGARCMFTSSSLVLTSVDFGTDTKLNSGLIMLQQMS